MDFLIHSRCTPSAAVADDDPALNERHWAYVDRFADGMTARGPTLGPDRETWTGSFHVVNLSDPEAARDFVANEPYNQAGLFEEHRIWRFANILGQSMWRFAVAEEGPRFLVLARRTLDVPRELSPVPLADLPSELRVRLFLYGELRNFHDDEPAGASMAVQVPTRDALEALLDDARAGIVDCHDVEIHDWEFGGRR